MAVQFSRITPKLEDKQVVDALGQLQTEIERGFSHSEPSAGPDGIVRVDTAAGLKSYSVKDNDQHVVAITNGGPLTVALPNPSASRVLGVIGSGANACTVQRSDGKLTSFGASKSLTNAAAVFVADGTDWYLG